MLMMKERPQKVYLDSETRELLRQREIKVKEKEKEKEKVEEEQKLGSKQSDYSTKTTDAETKDEIKIDINIIKEKTTTKSVAIMEHFFFGKLLQNLPQKTMPTRLDIICKYLYEMYNIAEKSSKTRRLVTGKGNRVGFYEEQKYKKRIIKNIRYDLIMIWKGIGTSILLSDEKIDHQIESLVNEALKFVNSPQIQKKCNSLKNSQQWIEKIRKEKYGDIFEIHSHNDRADEDGISSENDFTEKTQMELLRKSRKNKQNDNEERCRASENHFTKKTQMELLTRSRKNKQDDLVVVREKISSKQKDAYDDVEYFCRSSANDFTEKTQRKQLYDDQHQGLLACFIKSYCKYEK